MTDDALLWWFPYAFPFIFVGMWLAATTVMSFLSGWFGMQQWYADDRKKQPLLKLGSQSGSMGFGIYLNGCLTLRAYPSGLGVGMWKIFGLFQKPLRIPWSEIEAEPSRSFFVPMVKLHLGRPSKGTLKVSARSWERLVNAVPRTVDGRQVQMPAAAAVISRTVAQALFVQWLVMSTFAACFFYFASRSNGPELAFPLAVCIGFPAVVFGIGQLIRYAREG